MSTELVRSILRLGAVLTAFVGILGASTSMMGAFAVMFLAGSLRDVGSFGPSATGLGLLGVVTWLVVIAWAVALFQMSPALARLVTRDPRNAEAVSGSLGGEPARP